MGVVNTCSGNLLRCLKRAERDYFQVAIKDRQNEMKRGEKKDREGQSSSDETKADTAGGK